MPGDTGADPEGGYVDLHLHGLRSHREFTIFALGGVAIASYREHGRTYLADTNWVTRAALGLL